MKYVLIPILLLGVIACATDGGPQPTPFSEPIATSNSKMDDSSERGSTAQSQQEVSEAVADTAVTPDETPALDQLQTFSHEIQMTSGGFSPSELTIQNGDTVTFTNADSRKWWPASDVHPTHRSYPGTDIRKCGTEKNMLDACTGLAPGESFSYTFSERGQWGVHDHLRSSMIMTITVSG